MFVSFRPVDTGLIYRVSHFTSFHSLSACFLVPAQGSDFFSYAELVLKINSKGL